MNTRTELATEGLCFGSGSVLSWALAQPVFQEALSDFRYKVAPLDYLNARAYLCSAGTERCIEVNRGTTKEAATLIAIAFSSGELLRGLRLGGLSADLVSRTALGCFMDLIVWHEIQHHGLGHVDYFHGPGGLGFFERPSQETTGEGSRRMTPLDRRACELSADGQAAAFIWRHQGALRSDPDSRYYRLSRKQMLVIMTFAAMLLFALVGDGEPDLLSYDESAAAGDRGRAYYPHPTVRVMHVDAQLERFSRCWWLRADRRLTLRAMVQAVRLARSGVLAFDVFEPIVTDPPGILRSSSMILNHWDHIAADVEVTGAWAKFPHLAVRK